MADYSFADLLGTAATAPESTSTNRDIVVPDGRYNGTIVVTNSSINAKGKLVIGLKFRVDDEGPAKGGGVWANQYLSPESPVALNIFFETFEALGVPRAHFGQFGSDFARAGSDVATRVKGVKAQIVVETDGAYGPRVRYINKVQGGATGTVGNTVQRQDGFTFTGPQTAPAVHRPATPF